MSMLCSLVHHISIFILYTHNCQEKQGNFLLKSINIPGKIETTSIFHMFFPYHHFILILLLSRFVSNALPLQVVELNGLFYILTFTRLSRSFCVKLMPSNFWRT